MWCGLQISIRDLTILPRYNFKIYSSTTLLFYSIILSSEAMALQIQKNLKRSKRKLSIFLDLLDSSFSSQNPSISTPTAKKKKVSFFSQSQPTQDIQNIPIYSESSLSKNSKSIIGTQKNQLFVEILKKTSLDLL